MLHASIHPSIHAYIPCHYITVQYSTYNWGDLHKWVVETTAADAARLMKSPGYVRVRKKGFHRHWGKVGMACTSQWVVAVWYLWLVT